MKRRGQADRSFSYLRKPGHRARPEATHHVHFGDHVYAGDIDPHPDVHGGPCRGGGTQILRVATGWGGERGFLGAYYALNGLLPPPPLLPGDSLEKQVWAHA